MSAKLKSDAMYPLAPSKGHTLRSCRQLEAAEPEQFVAAEQHSQSGAAQSVEEDDCDVVWGKGRRLSPGCLLWKWRPCLPPI